MAKAAGFSVNDQNIRDLKGSSPVLTLIREGFDQLLESNAFHVSTFQESVGYTGFGWMDAKVVPNESSEIGHSTKERKNLINANHMNMCRFRNAHDDGYIKTKGEIERHLERRSRRIEDVQGEFYSRCLNSFRVRQMSDRVLQIKNAHRETLKWLYEEDGPGLIQWLMSGSGIFWIQGKAGSGKSTAMKFLLENYQTLTLLNQSLEPGSWLLMGSFFTDRAERIQASWEGILHDMIYQLLEHCPVLMNIAYSAFLKRKQDNWDTDSLEKLLLTFFIGFHGELHVCFLIDALDEHDGQHNRMSEFLHELVSTSTESLQIKVVVASRPHNDLKDLFAGDRTLKMQEWTKTDIQMYVAGRLSRQPRW
ncbi:hypothetical protein LTR10_014795 [Elasticomyces elasticus]|uniref:Nephrocystin 3-like N-terminal domain-containing protein n=1 Tax=Exophiala sideris TaxID=1016849 RepID=A0ABR0JG15_9EURO|nr:hypothetical protein LTR10_014795 [Elasticomyces elasticus]KAK5025637.1 hypothetical protein LTS07_007841 [Exophiala sideris]KAK5033153.1 hypothetical protein LTR13_007118 [Exophiala sideris]KAK5063638.1 hypothetical protein LTR69_004344 [Exophiala sideris]KAK5180528.1 hypothetical protein LTR44_006842 [Eurotiomycetes sp. CCFEE 6388]